MPLWVMFLLAVQPRFLFIAFLWGIVRPSEEVLIVEVAGLAQ